jgi:hypothetical protein
MRRPSFAYKQNNVIFFRGMLMDFSLALSFVALIATFYQAHLQRVHNQKSVKPLVQVDLEDRDGSLYVRIQNNGVGPIIVRKLTFTKGEQSYERIQDGLEIDPKSYYHVDVNETNTKVIAPSNFLVVFSEKLKAEDKVSIDFYRSQLSALHVKVEGYDIYDNRVVTEKNLKWFGRHL